MISCSADAISLTPHAHTQIKSFVFKYAAVARRDEGFVKRWCFACLDSGRMYPPAVQCITIRIRLCEVFVEEDESLGNVESSWDFHITTLTRIDCKLRLDHTEVPPGLKLATIMESQF